MVITMDTQLILTAFIVLGHPNFPWLYISSTCVGKTVRPYNTLTQVNFELISAHHSDNQTDEEFVTRKVDKDPKIKVNFRNLFDSITKNDTRKTGTYRNILEHEAMKERQAFDTMKEELWYAYERKNLYSKNGGINEKVTAVKRQVQKNNDGTGNYSSLDVAKADSSEEDPGVQPIVRDLPVKDEYNASFASNKVILTSPSSLAAFSFGPQRMVAVSEVHNYRPPIENADEVVEHVFLMSLDANTSGVIVDAPTTRFTNRRRTTKVPFFLSDVRYYPTNTSTDNITSASTVSPEKVHRNLQPIFESRNFRISNDKRQYLRTHCGNISRDNIDEIAGKTVKQFKDPTYMVLRKYRLTASCFGAILHAIRSNSYPPSLYRKLLVENNEDHTAQLSRLGRMMNWRLKAVRWGKFHEASALDTLKKLYPSWNIRPTGLYLHESGLLGASPDGVTDEAVIEIKCPYRFRRSKSLEESLIPGSRYIITRGFNGTYHANTNHAYYDQVQAEILFSGKQYGLLFIWTPNEAKLFRIDKDESWAKNIDLILDFYMRKFVPYVLDLQQNDKTDVNKIRMLMV